MNKFSDEKISQLKAYPVSYRLQRLRWWSGYTQAEFAKLIGCRQASVSMWEREICTPNGRTLEKIISLYNLPYDFFVDIEIQKIKMQKKKKTENKEQQ